MQSVASKVEEKYKKKATVDVRSGDTVKVHQKIRESGKERVQVFEGTIINTSRSNSLTSSFTVRRIASGVGIEKTYWIHSPNILKIQVTKRSKVRRSYLSYMRALKGKSARLTGVEFDRDTVNAVADESAEAEEEKLKEKAEQEHIEAEARKAEEQAKEETKFEKAIASHEDSEPKTKEKDKEPETKS